MNVLDSIARRWGGTVTRPAELPVTDREKVFANPQGYTRASRRSVGYLKPVWTDAMRANARMADEAPRLSRYTRRHLTALFTTTVTTRRMGRQKARITRAFARRGITWAP